MRVRILFHGNCFDGAASAALFQRFHEACVAPGAEYLYRGLAHRPGGGFPPGVFDGDENVILDFRYSRDPRVGWWFDHHVSTFDTPEDEAHFRADTTGRKFFDPTSPSCTQVVARVAAERFGYDTRPHHELIEWARIIDGAQFPNAHTAVALEAPALRLMMWVEANKDPALTERFIAALGRRPLDEIVEEPWVKGPLEGLLAEHRRTIERIAARARLEGDVVVFDLTDEEREGFNKFIVYELFPSCRYSVGITRSKQRVKVSVGTNPWGPRPRGHDIAAICRRYGGGGHPVVGAVSLGPNDVERGKEIARAIVSELEKEG